MLFMLSFLLPGTHFPSRLQHDDVDALVNAAIAMGVTNAHVYEYQPHLYWDEIDCWEQVGAVYEGYVIMTDFGQMEPKYEDISQFRRHEGRVKVLHSDLSYGRDLVDPKRARRAANRHTRRMARVEIAEQLELE